MTEVRSPTDAVINGMELNYGEIKTEEIGVVVIANKGIIEQVVNFDVVEVEEVN